MDFTFELSKMFNVIPFEILKQDKDEVIMLINYMIEKGAKRTTEESIHDSEFKTEKEKDKSFWDAL
jgi:hypothetical protein